MSAIVSAFVSAFVVAIVFETDMSCMCSYDRWEGMAISNEMGMVMVMVYNLN